MGSEETRALVVGEREYDAFAGSKLALGERIVERLHAELDSD
jgi:hypothetical protein